MNPESIREKILELVEQYAAAAHAPKSFNAVSSPIPVSGRVYGAKEMRLLVDSSLDFWLTTGRYASQFEKEFAKYFGLRYSLLVNSGSSANLVALSALTSPTLKDRALKPGDEVITAATGFPTTVNPIFQNNLIPVFLDVHVPTYNVDVSQLEAALSPRTKAVMIAHTLGNPFDLGAVMDFAKKHNLWVIEDCCDAVGATYKGKKVGTFGHVATTSFYPAHHITMGEGGAVLVDDPALKKLLESFRDWGRDCWCDPGKDNTCGKRFKWQLGDLPHGYDHKYIYSHIGYNLKATDMQAAVGVAQMERLEGFIAARRRNFRLLKEGLRELEEFFILPEATAASDPSWFGFPLAVRPNAPFSRADIVQHLDGNRIGTRLLFGGNLIRQPAYKDLAYRAVGPLANSDFVMDNAFWIGVYPGITPEMVQYTVDQFKSFVTTLKTA